MQSESSDLLQELANTRERGEKARVLARLCLHYIGCDATERESIRQQSKKQRSFSMMVMDYAHQLREQIVTPSDTDKLKLALAAVSLENCSLDYRDTLTILASVFLQAERAGIDPRPAFAIAAEWSTDSATTGGCESLAHAMLNLETYAVLGRKPPREE